MTKKTAYYMDYDVMRYHIGHKIELNDVWDWQTNRESGLEIRCANKECEGCEPIFEIDNPEFKQPKN